MKDISKDFGKRVFNDRVMKANLSKEVYEYGYKIEESIKDRFKEIDERLHEVDFGIFEGMPIDTKEFYDVKYHLGMRYPGGETYLEVIHRVYSFLDDLKKTNYNCVLLVCHGAILRAINSYFHDMTNDDFFNYKTKNCQIDEYEL